MQETHRLFHLLGRIHHKIKKKGDFSFKNDELTMAQGHALMFLYHEEGHCATMKALERDLGVAQSTAAGMVSRLERNGFLEVLSDPTDKRIKLIKMTPKAEAFGTNIKNSVLEIEENTISVFTPEEQVTFLALLDKLEKSL
ncbi:MAG: MarR family winged helix-turn-helix transcriptional regulator [Eubacteriales bacterium]